MVFIAARWAWEKAKHTRGFSVFRRVKQISKLYQVGKAVPSLSSSCDMHTLGLRQVRLGP